MAASDNRGSPLESAARKPREHASGQTLAAQLSEPNRVSSDVSSFAIPRDLAGEVVPNTRPGYVRAQPAVALEGLSDAQIMLRVKAGDDAAFDYLVEKYRRPMMSFMYRMARNNAVAEELAQEVFLRVYRSRKTYAANAK